MPPKTTSKKAEAASSTTTKKAASSTTYKSNQNGIIANDDTQLVALLAEMKNLKDATDDHQQAFVDSCIKSKASNKQFLQRLWYSLMDAGIEKPSKFTSLKIDGLIEALFVARESVKPQIEQLYQTNKSRQYVNTHSISQSNMLTEKPKARHIVNVCQKVNDVHVKIGKGTVIADTQDDDSKVEVSITEVDSDHLLIHNDEEFKVGAILSWSWVDLATHIEAMKRKSAEDGALGTSLRPRTASSSVNGGGNSSNSGSTPSSSNNGGISSVVSGAGSSVNGGVGSSSSESVKITKLEKRIQQLNEQAKKYKATIEDLKRKRQEDALTIQSCKKQCERHDASMQQTKKLVLDFHNSILSMDIFEVKEGTYWITFEGVEKGVPSTKVNDMLKRKQPNVVIEQLIIIFSLGTVTTQQFRALDLIMTRICPLMKESKHRLKNFKDRKSKLFNRKAVDDGTTARAKVVLVDEDSNSTVLLQDAEQNTDISTDGIVNNNNNMNIDNNIELNEECDEVLPCGDDDDVGIIN